MTARQKIKKPRVGRLKTCIQVAADGRGLTGINQVMDRFFLQNHYIL
ncbi:hypothetical protein P262_04091 [Cronobacter malonaticus]|uniref:Uncharacterized protein n=1 Tax=Cronobacter malonaticus TaxID=413503 RepID=V5U1M9_9ENTR|nr:hypothetical protein P262_04091 [Cronobacter malonaticus]